MYWRRFAVASIPINDPKAFEKWLMERWLEKEDLLEGYVQNGRFPAEQGDDSNGEPAIRGTTGAKASQAAGFIETEVKVAHWFEIGQIFVVLGAFALLANLLAKVWNLVMYGSLAGWSGKA